MSRILVCAGAVAFLLVGCSPEDLPKAGRSQKELAQMVFEALRADDPAQLAGAAVSPDDLEWTLRRLAKIAPEMVDAARKKLESAGGAETAAADIHAGTEKAFARTRQLSAEVLDWATASFLGVDLDRTRVESRFGYETADIWFGIRAGEATHDFVLTRCINTPTGWKTSGALRFPAEDPTLPSAAAQRRTMAQLRSLGQALKLHVTMHDALPETLEVLLEPDAHSGEALLDAAPQDPWGNAIRYERTGDGKFRLSSAGQDRELGTDDDVVFPEGE